MKISRAIIVLVWFAGVASSARAQGFASDSLHHFRLSLAVGGGTIASYDNVGSPLPYSGPTAPMGGAIEYVTPNVQHRLELTSITSLGNAPPLRDQYGAQVIYGFEDLRYSYLHYLRDIGSTNIHFSMGGAWENLLFARAYDYEGNLSTGSGSGEMSSSIAACAEASYEFGSDHRVQASLSLPLVALVLRPAYGYANGESSIFSIPFDSRIEPIGVMWSWRVGLDYTYVLSRYFLLGLHYHQLYYNYPFHSWKGVGAEGDILADLTWGFDL